MTWFILYVVIIGFMLGISYLLAVKGIGQEAASRNLFHLLPWFLVGFLLSSMAPLLARWQYASWGIVLVYVISVGIWLLSWPSRKRAAGSLLLGAGRTWQNKLLFWNGVAEVAVAIVITWVAFGAIASPPDTALQGEIYAINQIPKVAFWWTVATFFVSIGLNKLELRENGICFLYTFISWQRMKSYVWERSKPNTLTVRFAPLLPLLPGFISIVVPKQHCDEVNQIIQTHLSTVPSF